MKWAAVQREKHAPNKGLDLELGPTKHDHDLVGSHLGEHRVQMSAEIINLRRARKAKSRSTKEEVAEQNRARFGMTRSERQMLRDDKERTKSHLDGHALVGKTPGTTAKIEDDSGSET